jgi:mannitol-1-phosphate 5-dehydrogenase
MLESALALHQKFSADLRDLTDHIRDLLCRFNNRALKDTCARVGADIERKLGPLDRFIGAMRSCEEQGVAPAFISVGAAAALYCLIKERGLPQTEESASAFLESISKLDKNSAQARLILDMHLKIRQGKYPEELFQSALFLGKKPEVI